MRTLEKRLQRSRAKQLKKSITTTEPEPSSWNTPKTPRSWANSAIRRAGVSPRSLPPQIRKQLLFAQVMADEVKSSVDDTSSSSLKKSTHRGLAASVVAGNLLRRYRCIKRMSDHISVDRGTLSKAKGKLAYPKKSRLGERQKKVDKAINEFLERDDNSRMLPGKGDFTKCNGVKLQKRYLNDYMHNLHAKFRAENSEFNISRSVFCRRRPPHIFLTSFTSRNTCLSQHHQNMSLKLRGIKACGINVATNPDTFIKENGTDDGSLHEIISALPNVVKYSQWKRVDEADGKKKMKLIPCEQRKDDFTTTLKEDVLKF